MHSGCALGGGEGGRSGSRVEIGTGLDSGMIKW